ncbi:aldehyde dehydrogenase family protein [Pedobacter sandarakinus]|uniref:aldehyde dehydrogenase family protein n=1 Tax=Pedobacter sandarakinus TaxID=353156 RepID=UPI002246371C|nr:aldehyde dehydrogenase family protein [Pedobacter sandarakinus]MCX2573783.1 aldehyde dehydrogenase family protein [Pedobacter sandarakinus]
MENTIKSVFNLQQQHQFTLRETDAKIRAGKLKKLKHVLVAAEEEIFAALEKDLRKSKFETAVTELYFIYAELDHAIKNVKTWMKPKSAGRTMTNLFARNRIYSEPKGVCLIVAPWNYPFQLIMSPLISAIAAGNCAIIKPSELSLHTAAIIAKLIKKAFEPEEVACFEGDAEVSTALLKLPFDHIFFTGSIAIGKVVMEAAAKNLSSVTLELGGKSPAMIDRSANLKKAAEKIAWGKLVNAGQTCIAPDYVLIPAELEQQFIEHYQIAVLKMFFNGSDINLSVYGKIINEKQFQRLDHLINNAIADGAKITFGGERNSDTLTINPTVLTQVNGNNAVMQEEIFGPILPIITYNHLDEAIHFINTKNKPLSLYIFSEDNGNVDEILTHTSAGGTCVNDVLVHISNPNLPFGGVNSSGMGSCHGIYGFKNFTHERSVMFQSKFGLTKLIYPPYNMALLKWLKKVM